MRSTIFYLKNAVSGPVNCTIDLEKAMTECTMAVKETSRASLDVSSMKGRLLVAELGIMSQIMSNLTKPEDAIPCSLQFLQELHELREVQDVFSILDLEGPNANSVLFYTNLVSAKPVFKINRVLFEFVQAFLRPPPTVEEWPATIQLSNERNYNPLFDGQLLNERLMRTEKAVLRKVKFDPCGEVCNKVQSPVTDVAGYSVMITESCEETPDNR